MAPTIPYRNQNVCTNHVVSQFIKAYWPMSVQNVVYVRFWMFDYGLVFIYVISITYFFFLNSIIIYNLCIYFKTFDIIHQVCLGRLSNLQMLFSQNHDFSHMPTDIQGRSQNLRHFYPGMGLKLGSSGFSRNQINRGSTSALCLLHLMRSVEDCGHICFTYVFACMVGKKPQNPQFEPHGWRRH